MGFINDDEAAIGLLKMFFFHINTIITFIVFVVVIVVITTVFVVTICYCNSYSYCDCWCSFRFKKDTTISKQSACSLTQTTTVGNQVQLPNDYFAGHKQPLSIDPAHDDIIAWKGSPYHWPFVPGIPSQRVNNVVGVVFVVGQNKQQYKLPSTGDLKRMPAMCNSNYYSLRTDVSFTSKD